jgi:K+-sensing histidine kinase KdpD
MDIQGDLSLRLLASRNLLVESVLGNLVSNAIKFSPRGSNLTFAAERQNGEVKMAVMDSGPGVPGEVLAHLNDEGAVASTPGTEGEKGSGFGLQLVGEHLSRMGGRLELKPRAAGGTEAAVWLPSAST